MNSQSYLSLANVWYNKQVPTLVLWQCPKYGSCPRFSEETRPNLSKKFYFVIVRFLVKSNMSHKQSNASFKNFTVQVWDVQKVLVKAFVLHFKERLLFCSKYSNSSLATDVSWNKTRLCSARTKSFSSIATKVESRRKLFK